MFVDTNGYIPEKGCTHNALDVCRVIRWQSIGLMERDKKMKKEDEKKTAADVAANGEEGLVQSNNKKDCEHIKLSVIKEHYKRCKHTILKYAVEKGAFRPILIGHDGWWDVQRKEGTATAKLYYPDDETYNRILNKISTEKRSLYWAAQFFESQTANIVKRFLLDALPRPKIEEQIGGRKDTVFHSFLLDLDVANVKDIRDPEVQKWLETALKFFADKFLENEITSFGLAFSGGGCYFYMHPQLGVAETKKVGKEDEYEYNVKIIQRAFDLFIGHVADEFFKIYPEALEFVKFDKLNYDKKRQVKTILSIHKRLPYAVIPLDQKNPKIDLDKATLPISDDVIKDAETWLQYDENDWPKFGAMMEPWLKKAQERENKTHGKRIVNQEEYELPFESWAPCMKKLITLKKLKSGGGATRGLAVLASYMRFVGVPEEKAYNRFNKKAQEWNAETSNIFETWYVNPIGKDEKTGEEEIVCFVPSCEKVKTKGGAYPHLDMGDLEICEPDERCNKISGVMEYHTKSKKVKHGAKDIVEIPLKYGDFGLGVMKIRRSYEGGLLVKLEAPDKKNSVSERAAPTDFYTKEWYLNLFFKKIKKELGEEYEDFLAKNKDEIGYRIDNLPETENKTKDNNDPETKGTLEDGRVFEEILRDGKEMFVVYNPETGDHEYLTEVKNGERTIYPLPISKEERNCLMLADGIEEYGSLAELREEMVEFALAEYDPVKNGDLFELCVYLALTTWIAPNIMENLIEKFMPIVSVRGGSETGKKRFLTVMRYLTYRSMYVLKTQKVPTLFRMVAPWSATLILDEADLSDSHENAEFVEFANARADGVSIPRYNATTGERDFFKSFGMTVLAERTSAVDDGYESRKVIMPSDATPNPEKYALIPKEEWSERGRVLLRKLLLFKFRHMNTEISPNLTIKNVHSFRVRESLLVLDSLRDEDDKIGEAIEKIAEKLEKRIIIERANSMDGLILNIVYGGIIDENGVVEVKGENYEIVREREGKHRPDGSEEEPYKTPITLSTISLTMGKVLSPSEVARRWRGLHQGTRAQGRVGYEGKKKMFRGIMQIQNLEIFLKHLKKYVVDPDIEAVKAAFPKLRTQKEIGEEE